MYLLRANFKLIKLNPLFKDIMQGGKDVIGYTDDEVLDLCDLYKIDKSLVMKELNKEYKIEGINFSYNVYSVIFTQILSNTELI